MQYAWLEKLSSEGYVRPEAREQIYRDCSNLLKLASQDPQVPLGAAIANVLGQYFLMRAAGAVEGGIIDSFMSARTLRSIRENRDAIATHPDFAKYPEKADARFMALAKVAPIIAAQKERAETLVREKLHTGFSSQDMGNLAVLQAVYSAKDPGYASRMSTKLEKKAGESLGGMYADMLCIVKEAGVAPGIRAGTMWHALRNMALVSSIPILAGVGAGAVKAYAASRDNKALAGKLRESYERALRDSDAETSDEKKLSEDPAKAYQAFQTLAHFAPHVAMQPTAARSFMKRMIGYSEAGIGVDIDGIKGLTDIEKNISLTNKGESPFFSGFHDGSALLGLSNILGGTLKDTLAPFSEQSRARVEKDLGMSSRRP